MEYKWKILDIFAKDTVITGVKYHLVGTEGEYSVETEGNFYFDCPTEKVPFAQVTQDTIIGWLEKEAVIDDKNHIKMGIEKQIEALKSHQPTPMPWKPQVFKVQL